MRRHSTEEGFAIFKYIELFAGIGGFRQALDKLGGQCVFASEIDKFAIKSYKAIYGDTPEGDIKKIDAKDIPDHDLLTAGFPCQTFSVAGLRRGFEDVRGTLFFEIARIAAEKQPRLMLLENVKGLLSHDKGRTFETMCVVLNDLGYAIDFNVLNSKYFGVPQNRERIFIVCARDIEHADWNIVGNDVVAKAKRRIKSLGARTFNFDWPTNNEVTTRLRDILENAVAEKYYISEEKTAKLIAQLKICPAPSGLGIEEIRPVLTPDREEKRQNGRRFKEDGEESFTLTTQDRHGVAIGAYPHYRIRKLTPRECWRLQGFPDDAFDKARAAGVNDSQLYKQAGNAVTVNVIEAIGERLIRWITSKSCVGGYGRAICGDER